MKWTVENSLENFPAWSGGKDTLDFLVRNDLCKEVEELFEELFYENPPSETDVNDALWFDREGIASHLGYGCWEDLEEEYEGDGKGGDGDAYGE